VKVAGADVEVDRDVCIGAGMCVMNAPEVFDQDDEGIVVVLVPEVPAEHAAAAARAVASCPSGELRRVGG
jgi:ferredoxin